MEIIKYNQSTINSALKEYRNSASNGRQITKGILEYCDKNNDFTYAFKLLAKHPQPNILKVIVTTILRSKNNESIFELYKLFRKETPYRSGYWFETISQIIISRKVGLLGSSQYRYYSLQDMLLNKIKKPDFIDMALLLAFETQSILSDYKKIKFDDFPETDEALKLFFKKGKFTYDHIKVNYPKFFNHIAKQLKLNKTIFVLYLLNNYGGFNTKGDAKLWADKYIEAFVLLGRYDILAKYYTSFDLMSDIRFLQHITEYFIKEKKLDEAKEAIKRIESIEPVHPYINKALAEVENISLINKMLSKNINIEEIDKLSGKEFEDLLIKQFQNLGYKTTETPTTGDFGADIIVETESETRFIIQCKRFKNKVNLKAVQEVVGALAHFNGDIGIVITSNNFLNSAIKLAESNDIELWEKSRLMKFLSGDVSFSEIFNS